MILAEISLERDGVLAWTVVGVLAGFFAGVVMDPGRYRVGDAVAALIGALIGGGLFAVLVGGDAGFAGSIPVAGVSACALVVALRTFAPANAPR